MTILMINAYANFEELFILRNLFNGNFFKKWPRGCFFSVPNPLNLRIIQGNKGSFNKTLAKNIVTFGYKCI